MKATSKRSIELYQALSHKQQAVLCFELAASQDHDEIERLVSQVERRDYSTPHVEYIQWRQSLFSLSQVWAGMYWRQLFFQATSVCKMLTNKETTAEAIATADDQCEAANQARRRQAALQAVLIDLCHQHGLSLDAMVKLSGVPWCELEAVEADTDFQTEMLVALSGLLPSAGS